VQDLCFARGVSSTGVGIAFPAFPATQSASSDANTLDDYEEGTWTGTLTGTVSNPSTAVTATGKYTKIGNTVAVQVFFENKNTSGASGDARVSGLPFSISDNTAGAAMTEQMLHLLELLWLLFLLQAKPRFVSM
jgi:hypothetical protein